jgi:hypothetical protein
MLLEYFMDKIICIWHSDLIMATDDADCKNKLNADFNNYLCALRTLSDSVNVNNDTIINFGICPWKLFHTRIHKIEKTPNYLQPWQEKINEVLNTVKHCADMDMHTKHNYYNNVISQPKYTIIE